MKFVLIPLLSVAVCQVIKFIIYFWHGGKLAKGSILWEGFWVAKFPSSHSALIASSLYILWISGGLNAIFGFASAVSLMFIYSLLEDKKRQEVWESYIIKSKDYELRKIVIDRKLREFSGHTFFEIVVGAIIGLITAFPFI